MTRTTIRVILFGVLAAGAILGGWQWWQNRPSPLPKEIVSGNGRIEADQVDIATKYAGRVKDIFVHEGDLVHPGQVLAQMDTLELEAELAKARAELAKAEAAVKEVEAVILQRKSELKLAEQELVRAIPLVRKGSLSRRVLDQRQSQRDQAAAAVNASKAGLNTQNRTVDAARAEVKRIQTRIDDTLLRTRVVGRVLYRLTQEGEVLPAGGKVLTLVDLSEVYMEIFLPSPEAGRLTIGAEARIVVDAMTSQFAIPAKVSFVAPEAQFTPKQVETKSEREKLMFRVKVNIPRELVLQHVGKVKTGMRGVAYVRLDDTVAWPASLEIRLPEAPQ